MIRRKKVLELMKKAEMVESKPKKPKALIEVITSPSCPYCPIAWAMVQEIKTRWCNSEGSKHCNSRRTEELNGAQHHEHRSGSPIFLGVVV